jgi:hypothetical protein
VDGPGPAHPETAVTEDTTGSVAAR